LIAFSATVIVQILLLVPLPFVAKRRPPGTPLSWGEALLAATYVFFIFWWAYGVLPHYWLTWADNELGWRVDNIVWGPGNILRPQAEGGWLPLTVSYQAVRDIIVVVIYGIGLVVPVIYWSWWQGRGDTPKVEVESTAYGRPLVKKGA
jgi:hypothetical protein